MSPAERRKLPVVVFKAAIDTILRVAAHIIASFIYDNLR